jgi:hypothetical protein
MGKLERLEKAVEDTANAYAAAYDAVDEAAYEVDADNARRELKAYKKEQE